MLELLRPVNVFRSQYTYKPASTSINTNSVLDGSALPTTKEDLISNQFLIGGVNTDCSK